MGRKCVDNIDEILESFDSSQMLFMVGGMGGGTCSGALPIISKAAKEKGKKITLH